MNAHGEKTKTLHVALEWVLVGVRRRFVRIRESLGVKALHVVLVWIPALVLLFSRYILPMVNGHPGRLLLACAGWANVIALIDIAADLRHVPKRRVARACRYAPLLVTFVLILAWDLILVLGTGAPAYDCMIWAGIVVLLLGFLAMKTDVKNDKWLTNTLTLAGIAIVVGVLCKDYIVGLVKIMDSFSPKLIGCMVPNWAIEPLVDRTHVYAHLLVIPLAYLLTDGAQFLVFRQGESQKKMFRDNVFYDWIAFTLGVVFATLGWYVAFPPGPNRGWDDLLRLDSVNPLKVETVAAAAFLVAWNIAYVHREQDKPSSADNRDSRDNGRVDVSVRAEGNPGPNEGHMAGAAVGTVEESTPMQTESAQEIDGRARVDYRRWTERVWKKAESGWLERDGQDHFYRRAVILPALVKAVDAIGPALGSIVDVGSGDGLTSALLLAELRKRQEEPVTILIDRSPNLLEAARHSPGLHAARIVQRDIGNSSWSQDLRELAHPAIFMAVFVVQELPSLARFFAELRQVMSRSDRLVVVVPAPRYVGTLGSVRRLERNPDGRDESDWRWAGEYPISTPRGTFFLPHFDRVLKDYQRAAAACGLRMFKHEYLSVPKTPEARAIFEDTVYGARILGRPSSLLMTFSVA